MARKASNTGSSRKSSPAVASTPVRNTPIPKSTKVVSKPVVAATPSVKHITYEDIARRAYEIWCSGHGASELENWLRAERELKGL